jgi:DNA integrity scanning protein DisA with diadenylate cyclase activity
VYQALEQIDMQTLQSVVMQLINGDIEGAKDVFITHTNLIDAQINDLVAGMNREVEQIIAKYQDEFNSATEAVATYSQAVLWAVFSASAIGLVLSILGGSVGAAMR